MSHRVRMSVTLALALSAAAAHAQSSPAGVSPEDLSGIRAAYESARHAVRACDVTPGRFAARNPGQQWLTTFDGRGFITTPDHAEWSWGLDLVSFGRGDDQQHIAGVAHIHPDGSRVEYIWNSSLTEWFINDQRGVEHGYTLSTRPLTTSAGTERDQSTPLTFTIAIRGGLTPRVSNTGRDVTFVSPQGHVALTYNNLKVFDADGVHLPASFRSINDANCQPQLLLTIDDTHARYPVTIDPTAQQAYIKSSNPEVFDVFGFALAMSGDTVVVGAYGEDSSSSGVNGSQTNNSLPLSGAAYVFVRSGSTWTQQAYLKASNPGFEDEFGRVIAISGNTIVIGVPMEDSTVTGINNTPNDLGNNSGAAYVFVRNGTTWSQQAFLKASNTGNVDRFGIAVAISGDTIIVGAPGEASGAGNPNGTIDDNSVSFSGAAYVFVRSGTTWTQQAFLKASNLGAFDNFGNSVAIDGQTAIVGAIGEASNSPGVNGNQSNNAASASGAAYVFVRSGTVWSQQAYLKASNTESGDEFASAMALSGDTAVIAASREDSNATGVNGDQTNNSANSSGAAYVFTRSGTSWSQQAYLKASNTRANATFATSVAIDGNVIVVGSQSESSGAVGINGDQSNTTKPASGAAYVFLRSGTSWAQLDYLKASNTQISYNFGNSVAIVGNTVVVGSPNEASNSSGINGNQTNTSAGSSGAAYAFTLGLLPPANILASPATVAPGESAALFVSDPGPGLVIDWFTGSCGGTPIATGNPIILPQSATTVYFARARRLSDGETSGCLTVLLTVAPRPCSSADIANTDGDAPGDGFLDNGDFTAFFNLFFNGCPTP